MSSHHEEPLDLVDVGANLAHRRFREDLGAVLERAHSSGVATIVVTGTSVAASRAAFEVVVSHGSGSVALRSTAGIHPHEARSFGPESERELSRLLARPEVVCVGECGLDYDRMFSTREEQLRAFEAQLDLAISAKKPVFLHEREAYTDFAEVLARKAPHLVGGIVHCFTGDARALDTYLGLGMDIGMTGFLCDERRGTHLRALVKRVPAGRLHVETDAPFLVPRDLRPLPKDGRNEPRFLPHVLAAVAHARQEPIHVTAKHTREASARLFGLEAT
jgi:TatD DNase family protein